MKLSLSKREDKNAKKIQVLLLKGRPKAQLSRLQIKEVAAILMTRQGLESSVSITT